MSAPIAGAARSRRVRGGRSTTIRGWYEDATIDRISARNTRIGDSVTPWIAARQLLFEDGRATPMSNPGANDPLFSRNTVRTNVLLFGATAGGNLPLLQWGSTGTSVAASQPVYSVVTKGPDDEPYHKLERIHITTASLIPLPMRSRSTAPARATW